MSQFEVAVRYSLKGKQIDGVFHIDAISKEAARNKAKLYADRHGLLQLTIKSVK